MKTKKRFLSILLSLALVLGIFPGMSLTAYAEGAVSYVYYTISGTTVTKHTDGSCATYTTLANDTTTLNEGWYVVPAGGVTIVSRITVSDTVNLILTDGATLTATKGIDVPDTATLNIYAQNGETGTLFAGTENGTTATLAASDGAAGIGGGKNENTGSINIHGGKITAMGGYAPGIGGGYCTNYNNRTYGGTIVIYGGEINATAGSQSAGIGSASGNSGGSVTIYGGTINASSLQMAPGIGSGRDDDIGVDVTIYGGIINAQGGNAFSGGTGIGGGYYGKCGNITINGGTVTAIGGVDDSGQGGPGIGGGESGTGIGNIVINGGTVTAIGEGGSAGIGGFRSYSGSAGANVTINGGTVIASGSTAEGTEKTMDWDTHEEIDITYSYTGVAIGGSSYVNSNNTNNIGQNGNLTLGEGCYLYGGASESPENDLSNYRAGAGSYIDDRYLYMTVNSVSPKSEQTITVADVTVTYGDTGKSVSATTDGNGAISYAVKEGSGDYIDVNASTGALTIKKVPADGKAYVTVTAAETATYAQATKDVTVTINKANAVAATVTANNRTYDGTEKPMVTVTGEPTGGTMQYALGTKGAATGEYKASIPTATNAGTYYVWYKAVGTDGHADSAAACVTVTISEPSSGGGGGGYSMEPTTETAPSIPTETYTIPVENESSVNVQADIQNGNAKVAEITEEDINKVTEGSSGEDSQGKTVDNNTILIDLSGATQEVKSVELSKTTLERLAETATSTENKIETVTVQLTNVMVELDAKTLSAVTQQAEGNSINLVVEDTNSSTLNSDQQQALSEFTSASTFEAYFESGGNRIHDFRGGEATVSMKFTPAQGLSIMHYHVYYVAPSGKLERFVTRFIETLITTGKSDKKGAAEGEGILQFTTTHFSDYAIVYDETMENATGREEADDTSSGEDKTKTANGKSSYENGLSINKGLKVSQKGETIQISWGKVKGADGYDVYVQYCGKAFSSKPAMGVNREVTSVTIKKINGKKLNLKKNYKIFVVAYKNVAGKKKRLAKSIVAHIVGAKNTRYSNPKELTITSDTDVTLEKGKTSTIKARVILANAKRKSLSDVHAPMFRYASSDKKIATVDKKGKITAKKQGSCLIWVYAKNGYAKKVKVTVK